jgi:hypothetical protein
MKLTKTEQKYKNMIVEPNRVWTETEIISFRSFVNTKNRQRPEINKMLIRLFHEMIDQHGNYGLTPSQQIKGIQWLKRTQLKRDGSIREAKTTFIGLREKYVIDNFLRFEMIGLRDISQSPYSSFTYYVPIYRCIAHDGAAFEYSASQSGCEVVG